MISIIIPTLNERASLGPSLRALEGQDGPWEALVADGGSVDGTVEIAAQAGPSVRLVAVDPALKGRAPAYNAAAAEARGDILLFLHADVMLPHDALNQIRRALREPAIVGGGFVPTYYGHDRLLRLMTAAMAWNTTRFKHLAGDQAVFVRAAVFHRMGGFVLWPLMEDFEFSDRLKRYGELSILRPGVVSSPRRALANGIVRTQLLIFVLWSMYRLGVAPERLARYYARWSRAAH